MYYNIKTGALIRMGAPIGIGGALILIKEHSKGGAYLKEGPKLNHCGISRSLLVC